MSIKILNQDNSNQINPYNILILSKIYIKQHKWISSILILESGINQENTIIEQLYNNIGFCYIQIKAYNLSKLYYKKAIQQKPQYKSALYNLGQIYQILNDYKNADEIYKKIMQLDKNCTNQKISKYCKE